MNSKSILPLAEIAGHAKALANILNTTLGTALPQILTAHDSHEICLAVAALEPLLNPKSLRWDDPARSMMMHPDTGILNNLMTIRLCQDEAIGAVRAQVICHHPNLTPRNIFAAPTVLPTPDSGCFVDPLVIAKLDRAADDLKKRIQPATREPGEQLSLDARAVAVLSQHKHFTKLQQVADVLGVTHQALNKNSCPLFHGAFDALRQSPPPPHGYNSDDGIEASSDDKPISRQRRNRLPE